MYVVPRKFILHIAYFHVVVISRDSAGRSSLYRQKNVFSFRSYFSTHEKTSPIRLFFTHRLRPGLEMAG